MPVRRPAGSGPTPRASRAAIVDEARQEARAEATRITEAATVQIESERRQAMVELRRNVGSLAVDLAEPDRRRVARGRRPPARDRRPLPRRAGADRRAGRLMGQL